MKRRRVDATSLNSTLAAEPQAFRGVDMAGAVSWGKEKTGRGVRERVFEVPSVAGPVPSVLWTPEKESPDQPVILIGHGGSGNKTDLVPIAMARRFVRHHGFSALAIDGPAHGDRRPKKGTIEARDWWSDGQTDQMVADWKAALDAVQALPDVGKGLVGYWGLSMGTIFGVPFVAAEPRVQVAVLGLMGITGRTKDRIEEDAASISVPVLFLQQLEDELFDRPSYAALFDVLGSSDKRLHANPGAHAAVPREEMAATEEFLAGRLKELSA